MFSLWNGSYLVLKEKTKENFRLLYNTKGRLERAWWKFPLNGSVVDMFKKKPQESRVGTSFKGKSWGKTPLGEYRRYILYTTIYELYNVCIGQYGVIFWEQLLGYPPKGTQLFLLNLLAMF